MVQFLIVDSDSVSVRCGEEIEKEIQAHAREEWPNEVGGCVLDGSYVRLENRSDNPTERFYVPSGEFPDDAQALVHSHTKDIAHPTADDMRQQQAMDIPWGIVSVQRIEDPIRPTEWFGDQCPVPSLVGRSVLSGVRDCWSIVRDWFRTNHDISLDQLPRDHDWYKPPEVDLLNPNTIESAGFVHVSKDSLQVGDVILGKIGSRVTNHSGLYWGNNLVLTQIEGQGRLSKTEPVNSWLKQSDYVVRHSSLVE